MTVEANFEVGFFIVFTFWAMICVCTFNWYKISHLFHCFGLCKNQHILKVKKLRTGNSEKFHMWYMQCKYLWIKPLCILMFFVFQMLFTNTWTKICHGSTLSRKFTIFTNMYKYYWSINSKVTITTLLDWQFFSPFQYNLEHISNVL